MAMDSKHHEQAIFRTKILLSKGINPPFAEWQSRYHSAIAQVAGFISLEISSSEQIQEDGRSLIQWEFTQIFTTLENLIRWKESSSRKQLLSELRPLLKEKIAGSLVEYISLMPYPEEEVIEVIITEVKPEYEASFRTWIGKIHEIESKFPGFLKVHVQAPSEEQGKTWITLVQFDTTQNLDRWLYSSEREELLKEGSLFVKIMEGHRVLSSFAGWFADRPGITDIPPAWKQTMLVLLGLFPIVMLEIKFLSPLFLGWHSATATFIGNALSVSLISWPVMPLLIRLLGWWLTPQGAKTGWTTVFGTGLVLAAYLLEVAVFLYFF